MEKIVKERRFFYILTLILLAGFLVFPSISLANEFDDVALRETAKYLELPGDKVQDLIRSFINIFHSEWENLAGSGYVSAEKMAVPSIMKKAVQVQVLNHLLIDAPVETTWVIIKNTVKMTRLFLGNGFGSIFEEIEKESVKSAIAYGINALFENEIRVSPGALEFEYELKQGGIGKALIQYIMIYRPSDNKSGEMIVKFYSPNSLKIPQNKQSIGGQWGIYTELTHDLPPFIIDIRGNVQDYKWVGNPSVKIDFPPKVPDLGIKPLSRWEKYLLKPIETRIKEVEIIITKITGKSLGLVDIWNEIKSFIAKIKSFAPAGLVETSGGGLENISNILNLQTEKLSPENLIKNELQLNETEIKQEQEPKQELTLEEMQEILDDIAERIDILNQQAAELVEVRLQQTPKIEEIEKVKELEKEEEVEELEESELIKQTAQVDRTVLCEKVGQPARNKIIFNEIAWMGTNNSANDEWIELKNISGTEINLAGWQLFDKDGQIKVVFTNRGQASVNGLLLLERTDDDSVPNVITDLIYTGGLGNTNESLYLFDPNCQLQDEVSANPNWLAGDNSSKRTMERKYDLSWQTSLNPGGTPKTENSLGYIVQPIVGGGGGGGGGGSVSQSPQQTSIPSSTSSLPQVLITEIQIETASSTNYDFIELYNSATNSVDISGFQLKKKSSTGNEYSIRVFSENSAIQSQSYFLWANSSYASSGSIIADATSSQTLAKNNSIVLFDNNENIFDAVAWGTSTNPFMETGPFSENPGENQSLGRKWSSTTQSYVDNNNNQTDFEIQNSTPRAQNQSPEPTPEQQPGEPLLTIVINEIAWMGTSATNSSDEWIEFYNNSTSTIDITSWKLVSADGSPDITFSTSSISANSYFLIERTDDTAVSDILADWKGSFGDGLKNTGEKLELKNASGTLIDLVDCSVGWFAGTTTPAYISMERINPAISGISSTNWANNNLITRNGRNAAGNNINGTPRAKNSVSISPTTISSLPFDEFPEITLTYYGNPYIIQNTLIIPTTNTLKIEPGVTLKFDTRRGLLNPAGLEVEGTLKAISEENIKIIFTSLYEPEYWNGIYFTASSTNSELNWAEIKYGRRNPQLGSPPAILVENSSIIFKNSILENYTDRGLKLINSSSTIEKTNFLGSGIAVSTVGIEIEGGSPTIKNSEIKNNRNGIYITLLADTDLPTIEGNNFEDNEKAIYTLNPNVVFKSNHGTNNQISGILIVGNISKENLTWYKNDLPYVIYWWIDVNFGKRLTIEPGVIVMFDNGAYFNVNGALLAQGTAVEPIIFTALLGQAPWRKIYFTASSTGSILENVIVNQGAGYNTVGQIYVEGSSIEFKNSTSTGSSEAGIYLMNSTSTISNSHFGNQQFGMKIYGSNSFPQLGEGITFENNLRYDIFIDNTVNWCPILPEYLATSTNNNCP